MAILRRVFGEPSRDVAIAFLCGLILACVSCASKAEESAPMPVVQVETVATTPTKEIIEEIIDGKLERRHYVGGKLDQYVKFSDAIPARAEIYTSESEGIAVLLTCEHHGRMWATMYNRDLNEAISRIADCDYCIVTQELVE